ncbi:MAG: HEAT repeat domain-containing protein [Fibrobacterota bacterium]
MSKKSKSFFCTKLTGTIVCAAILAAALPLAAKTRRSAVQVIPTADFLGGGMVRGGYSLLFTKDSLDTTQLTHFGRSEFGVTEQLNTGIDWVGEGVSFNMKGRVMSESGAGPSLAVGVRNLFNSAVLARDGQKTDIPDRTGEVYLAAGKTIDPYTVRFHGGVVSIPANPRERFNIFCGIEKYLGSAFYMTLEGWSLRDRFHLAFSSSFRFMENEQAELLFTLIDLEDLIRDHRGRNNFTIRDDRRDDWVRPGISLGFSFAFPTCLGGSSAFESLEDRYEKNAHTMDSLRTRMSGLEDSMSIIQDEFEEVRQGQDSLMRHITETDIFSAAYRRMYSLLLELDSAYSARPPAYDDIRMIHAQLQENPGESAALLMRIVRNEDAPKPMQYHAAHLLGKLEAREAVPLLLDELANTVDTRYKVELIVALGMIGDRDITYALENLKQSADEMVSTAAREVLFMWEGEQDEEELQEQSAFSIDPAYLREDRAGDGTDEEENEEENEEATEE